jgi:hypothetical protein
MERKQNHVDFTFRLLQCLVETTDLQQVQAARFRDELNYLRVKRRIQACWSHDGRIFAIGVNSGSTDLITCIDDIYFMLDKYPENHCNWYFQYIITDI